MFRVLPRAAVAVLVTIVAVLALGVGTASAHVSVSAPGAEPGGFGEITFRVPSESDTAKTTSLRVQLPTDTPLAFVSVKPVPGWTATTTRSQLPTPIETEGTTITEAVTEVAWTADPGTGLTPGQYQTFSISAGPLPEGVDTLTFPALQGYDDGSTVSWVDPTVEGQPEAEHPAPTLTLAAASAGSESTSIPPATSSASGSSGLAVTALVVGIVGLLAAIAGVVLALGTRRRSEPAASPAHEREREAASV